MLALCLTRLFKAGKFTGRRDDATTGTADPHTRLFKAGKFTGRRDDATTGTADPRFSTHIFDTKQQVVKRDYAEIISSSEGLRSKPSYELMTTPRPSSFVAVKGPALLASTSSSPVAPSLHGVAEIPAADVTLLSVLGRGGFGVVLKGRWVSTDVAVKVVKRVDQVGKASLELNREIELLFKLRHPNICSLFGFCNTDQGLGMVIELLDMSLSELLHNRPEKSGDVDLRVRVAHQTASGIAFLHRNNCMHRDVKTANVMLDHTLSFAKVCDFGLALNKSFEGIQDSSPCSWMSEGAGGVAGGWSMRHTAGIGTPRYMAPEVLVFLDTQVSDQGNAVAKYNESCDVYSFGLLLWEVMHRQIPFADYPGIQVVAVLARSVQRPPLNLPAGYEGLGALISSCWHHDPAERPPMCTCVEFLSELSGPLRASQDGQLSSQDPAHWAVDPLRGCTRTIRV